MKKSLILSLLSLSGISVFGSQLSPQVALNRLNETRLTRSAAYANINSSPVLKVSPSKSADFISLYVFDTRDGFMVVSADDCAAPLLGYGEGTLRPDEISPELKYWLDCYSSEIFDAATSMDDAKYSEEGNLDLPAIAPLVKAKWNQGNPYNLMAPEFNGNRSVSGCVAVAMAQVLNSHQWPETCQGGEMTYTTRFSNAYQQSLSINFDEVSFDWANMLDSYGNGDATQANKEAVANLIKTCGYSVQTYYSPGLSSAYSDRVPTALYKYFDYSPSLQTVYRNYYTTTEWENLIYNQLSQGLAVIYGGFNGLDGHTFVCDGYDGRGFFHINWGWGGMSDGYFRLSALDPVSQGIGGSSSGYYYDQDATINVAKPDMEIKNSSPYMLYSVGNFLSSQIALHFAYDASETVSLGESVEFIRGLNTGILNTSCRTVKGFFGISLVNESGEAINLYSEKELTLATSQKVDRQTLVLPADLKEGNYTVYPVFKFSENDEYIILRCPLTSISTLKMEVENGIAVITIGDYPDVVGVNAIFNTKVMINSYFSMDIELRNEGSSPYYGTIGASLKKDGKTIAKTSETLVADLGSGEQNAFNLVGKFNATSGNTLEPGIYELGLFDGNNNSISIENPVTVEVVKNSDQVKLSATAFNYQTDMADPGVITFTGTIKCDKGDFGGQATIWIFSYNDKNRYYSTASSFFFISEGESADFSATVTINEPDDYYAYIYINGSYIYKPSVNFSIKDEAGVDRVSVPLELKVYPVPADELIYVETEGLKTVSIFSLSGKEVLHVSDIYGNDTEINLGSLSSAIYILQAGLSNGKTITKRIIKR